MEEGSKGALNIVWIALGIFIALLIIGVVMYFVIFGSGKINEKSGDVTKTFAQIDELTQSKYDQTMIRGSEIISLIKSSGTEPLAIVVETKTGKRYNYGALLSKAIQATGEINSALTKTGTNMYYTESLSLTAASDPVYYTNFSGLDTIGHDKYINAAAQFKAELIKDVQMAPIGYSFKQQ